eukprot:gb/GECG01005465.1/.p1 GENE.gb/GECG01005465.1/~~gb/GECG01005465.1/.p1  ORF type:complete len:194 (+),score=36.59 gb/GECG01005465.1/:1-582(+)
MASRNVVNTKLVLLGNTSVGKSCLVVQFVRKEWYDYQEPTIGAAFLQQSVTLDDVTVKYEIWDTAGQERYRSLAPMYYRGAGAAIVVYDITNKESFDGAKSWITELQRRGDKNCIIALAGNKSDMAEEREVHTDEAMEYAQKMGILFKEVSAKTGENVNELFTDIARKLPLHESRDDDILDVTSNEKSQKKCC